MAHELLWLKHKDPKKVIGLMSGTSIDGIDACLAEISGSGIYTKIKILAFETYPYNEPVREAIVESCNPETSSVDRICQLNFYLGKLFAEAAKSIANKVPIPIAEIDLIGSHGQTIYHLPNPIVQQDSNKSLTNLSQPLFCDAQYFCSTLQIGEPSVIAQETGITTVADFRSRDMAAGGQGAPLIPYVDFVLFRDKEKGRALQNIGGIANVTFLPPRCTPDDVIAFDTGPGNMLIDCLMERITNNTSHFDEGGKFAAKGKVNDTLLATLLTHSYISKQPPKTTGREEFGKYFADKLYKDALSLGIENTDIVTTVTAFTAHTIAASYRQWILSQYNLSEVILSGGGSHNTTLIKFLTQYLDPSIKIHTTDTFGISPDAKEALAFAILANETVSGNPNNIPNATGAKETVVMGKIVPGKNAL